MVHTSGVWGPIIDPTVDEGPAAGRTRRTDLRITHAWDVDRQLADDFGRRYGATVVDDYGDRVGKVDGIILDDFSHGVHGLFFAYACVGGGIRSVAYQTRDWRVPGGILTIEHDSQPFFGCVQETTDAWCWIRVFGQQSFEQAVHVDAPFFVPLLNPGLYPEGFFAS